MTPLDYLLILEGLILVCAGIFWAVGEVFGRGNPDDQLRNMMRAFWRQISNPTGLHAMPGFQPVVEDESLTQVAPPPSKRGKKGDAELPRVVCTLNVKVVPGSGENRIAGRAGDAVKVEVVTPPEGGEANKIVTDLLSEMLGVPAYHIKLVRGHYDSRKLLQIAHISSEQLDEKLANL